MTLQKAPGDTPSGMIKPDYWKHDRVPGGEHTVVFRIVSTPYNTASPIALASSVLVLLLVMGALFWEWRSRNKENRE